MADDDEYRELFQRLEDLEARLNTFLLRPSSRTARISFSIDDALHLLAALDLASEFEDLELWEKLGDERAQLLRAREVWHRTKQPRAALRELQVQRQKGQRYDAAAIVASYLRRIDSREDRFSALEGVRREFEMSSLASTHEFLRVRLKERASTLLPARRSLPSRVPVQKFRR